MKRNFRRNSHREGAARSIDLQHRFKVWLINMLIVVSLSFTIGEIGIEKYCAFRDHLNKLDQTHTSTQEPIPDPSHRTKRLKQKARKAESAQGAKIEAASSKQTKSDGNQKASEAKVSSLGHAKLKPS